jgi:hypothetical protein
VLPFGRLCYGEPNAVSNTIGYAKHFSCSHDAVIRVYDAANQVIAATPAKFWDFAFDLDHGSENWAYGQVAISRVDPLRVRYVVD